MKTRLKKILKLTIINIVLIKLKSTFKLNENIHVALKKHMFKVYPKKVNSNNFEYSYKFYLPFRLFLHF